MRLKLVFQGLPGVINTIFLKVAMRFPDFWNRMMRTITQPPILHDQLVLSWFLVAERVCSAYPPQLKYLIIKKASGEIADSDIEKARVCALDFLAD